MTPWDNGLPPGVKKYAGSEPVVLSRAFLRVFL